MHEKYSECTKYYPVIIPAVTIIIVIYYVFLIPAVVKMLSKDVNKILLTFTFLALIPFPPFIIMGIAIMIIWKKLGALQE